MVVCWVVTLFGPICWVVTLCSCLVGGCLPALKRNMLHPVLVGDSRWPFTEDFLTVLVGICEYNFVCLCVWIRVFWDVRPCAPQNIEAKWLHIPPDSVHQDCCEYLQSHCLVAESCSRDDEQRGVTGPVSACVHTPL